MLKVLATRVLSARLATIYALLKVVLLSAALSSSLLVKLSLIQESTKLGFKEIPTRSTAKSQLVMECLLSYSQEKMEVWMTSPLSHLMTSLTRAMALLLEAITSCLFNSGMHYQLASLMN